MLRYSFFIVFLLLSTTSLLFSQVEKAVKAKAIFDEAETLLAKNTPEGFSEATPKYAEALKIWQEIGDERAQIMALNKLVDIGFYTVDYAKALEFSLQLLPITQKLGEKNVEGGVLGNIGWSYYSLGETRKALTYLEKSAELLNRLGEKGREASARNGIGMMNYDLGNIQIGIDNFNLALSLHREAGNRRGEVSALINLGKVADDSRSNYKALEIYEQALKIADELKNSRLQGQLYNNMGSVWQNLGEYQKAFDNYQKSLGLYRQVGHKTGEAIALNNLAALYRDVEDFENALKFIGEATAIYQTNKLRREEANALASTGHLYSAMGNPTKALEFYGKALEQHQFLENKEGKSSILRGIGKIHFDRNEFEKSSENYRLALKLSEGSADIRYVAESALRLARSLEKEGKPTEAEENFLRALQIQREGQYKSELPDTLYFYAKFEEKQGRREAALQKMAEVMQLIEDLRNSIVAQNLRISFWGERQKYFDFYINLLVSQHRREPKKGFDVLALRMAENARARSLLESIGQSQGEIRSGVAPELLSKEKVLRQSINAKESQRLESVAAKAADKSAEFEKELRELINEYRNLQAEIRRQSPQYASLVNPEPASLDEIQALLSDETSVLLEYFLGEEHSFLFVVSKNSLKIYDLPKKAEIEKSARKFYESLRQRGQNQPGETISNRRERLEKADNDLENSALELSRILLLPVLQDIQNKRLLIVASEILQYIPFGALKIPQTKMQSPQPGRRFLIETNDVVYLPSASSLSVFRKKVNDRSTVSIAVLADPVFAADDSRLKTIIKQKQDTLIMSSTSAKLSPVMRSSLSRLRFSRLEAEAVADFTRDDERLIALDFKANLEMAKSSEVRQAGIIHFATHGFVRSGFPELSGLVFSLVNETGAKQDGYLRLHEIYNLDLNTELVVLSACETALGKDIKGEGLIGLTHGFLTAGSKRVLASLWHVDDKATAQLMRRFYQAMLKENLRPAEALRKAQISMINDKNFSHPFYWAAFTLQGEYR